MRKALVFFIALVFSMACAARAFAQPEGKRQLLLVLLKGKWGFIDQTGKIIVEPEFDAVGEWSFSEGLIDIQLKGKWGFMDESGAIKIAPQFAEVRPFSEGLAAVKVGDRWGFVDHSGAMRIAPRFKELVFGYALKTFAEGLAAFKADGKWGFINKAGEVVIKPQFEEVQLFLHGIARVPVRGEAGQPSKVGYINKAGKYVSLPNEEDYHGFQELHAGNFSEGMSLVRDGLKWGFVNSEGEIVATGFEAEKTFSEGLAAVQLGGKWGFIDKSGRLVIQPRFDEAERFSEGLALVTEADRTLGYIDRTGKLVIKLGEKKKDSPPNRFFASGFKEGLAAVNLDDNSGYIDRTGKFVITLEKGDRGNPFSGELALVHRGKSTTFVDKTGKYLFEPKLLFDTGDWSEGLLAARDDPRGPYGYIDATGKFVIPPQFDQAEKFSQGLAHVRVVNKHGFIDHTGKFVFPLEFDAADDFFYGIAKVGVGDYRRVRPRPFERQKIGYIDTRGNYIWRPTD
ncbi:MAG TPA: WG repeat-containing protein [Pyrinomonadaceae bacterium]|jgi:hypothetical protein